MLPSGASYLVDDKKSPQSKVYSPRFQPYHLEKANAPSTWRRLRPVNKRWHGCENPALQQYLAIYVWSSKGIITKPSANKIGSCAGGSLLKKQKATSQQTRGLNPANQKSHTKNTTWDTPEKKLTCRINYRNPAFLILLSVMTTALKASAIVY